MIVSQISGGLEMGVYEGCMVAEELAFGCTGIMTAMEASCLGVSVHQIISKDFCISLL